MTADEFFVVTADDRYMHSFNQLIDGVLVVNQPKWRHQRIVGLMHARLLAWVERTGRGLVGLPIDVVCDTYNVFAPDVWWLGDTERLTLDDPLAGPPDLAIEVRSPATWRYDTGAKRARYCQYGLSELWLVDTKGEVVRLCRRSSADATTFDVEIEVARGGVLTSPLLPGLEVATGELFTD